METLEWVERLGGWAVVLLIVRWMISRLDAQALEAQATTKVLAKALALLQRTEAEENAMHVKIIDSQFRIAETQNQAAIVQERILHLVEQLLDKFSAR